MTDLSKFDSLTKLHVRINTVYVWANAAWTLPGIVAILLAQSNTVNAVVLSGQLLLIAVWLIANHLVKTKIKKLATLHLEKLIRDEVKQQEKRYAALHN